MIRTLARFARMHPAAAALLLAASLSLRIVGAGLLGPAVAGFAPICTGAQIVYIAVGKDGAPLPADAPRSERCDFAGLALAILPDAPASLPVPAAGPEAPRPAPAVAPAARDLPAHPPRGPPAA